ncbi:hypothetical protein BH24CHL4_BH24CHL4_18330 [soil metagenome]
MKCYFRIIRSNEATLEDFLPAKDLGRRLSNPDMEKSGQLESPYATPLSLRLIALWISKDRHTLWRFVSQKATKSTFKRQVPTQITLRCMDRQTCCSV